MKAAYRTEYGLSNVLSVRELETPRPTADEILIRVHAATVNRSDCHVLWGKPSVMRLFTGLSKPKMHTTGCDFAGQIVAIGEQVTSFKIGDKVMGFGSGFGCGSHAEFMLMKESKAVKRMVSCPEQLTYEEAAACIEGAFYSQGGVRKLNLQPGQKALVIGATGAIGSATVQLLKPFGVHITAVCRGQHVDLVKSLGAEITVDYEKEDWSKRNYQYDYIFDSVGITTFNKCKHLLTKKGRFLSAGGSISNVFTVLAAPLKRGKKGVFWASMNVKEGLMFITDEIKKGRFKPVIDRKYPLEKIAEAFDYVSSKQKVGNVILSMDGD